MSSVNKTIKPGSKQQHFLKQDFVRSLDWDVVETYLPRLALRKLTPDWVKSYKGVDLLLFEPVITSDDGDDPSPFTISVGGFDSADGLRAINAYCPSNRYGDKKVTLAFSLDEWADRGPKLAEAMRALNERLNELLSVEMQLTEWASDCAVVNNADQLRIQVHNDSSSRYSTQVLYDSHSKHIVGYVSNGTTIFNFRAGHRCAFTFTPSVWASREGRKPNAPIKCGVTFNALKMVGDVYQSQSASSSASSSSSSASASEQKERIVFSPSQAGINRARPSPLIRTSTVVDLREAVTQAGDGNESQSASSEPPATSSSKRSSEEADLEDPQPSKRALRSRKH